MANYQAAPAPSPAPAADYPGKTLGIVGLILAIVGVVIPGLSLIGIIVSAIALNQSKSAGYPNKLAKIGIIVGIVLTVLAALAVILYIVVFAVTLSGGVS